MAFQPIHTTNRFRNFTFSVRFQMKDFCHLRYWALNFAPIVLVLIFLGCQAQNGFFTPPPPPTQLVIFFCSIVYINEYEYCSVQFCLLKSSPEQDSNLEPKACHMSGERHYTVPQTAWRPLPVCDYTCLPQKFFCRTYCLLICTTQIYCLNRACFKSQWPLF